MRKLLIGLVAVIGCSDTEFPKSDLYKGRSVGLFPGHRPEDVRAVSVTFYSRESGGRRVARAKGGEAAMLVKSLLRSGRRHSDVANQVNVVEVEWKAGTTDRLAFGEGEELEAFGIPTGRALRKLMRTSKPLD